MSPAGHKFGLSDLLELILQTLRPPDPQRTGGFFFQYVKFFSTGPDPAGQKPL